MARRVWCWWPALLAAAAIEAAMGTMAAALANAAGRGHTVPVVFALCALGVVMADMVLVPGWVWAPLPPLASRLAGRALAAVLSLGAALCAGACAMLLVLLVGLHFLNGGDPGVLDIAVFGLPFMAAGGLAGCGAALTEEWCGPTGTVLARRLPQVAGGAFGVLPLLLLGTVVDTVGGAAGHQPGTWWPLLALAPATLVTGATLRNILLVREAVRAGMPLADNGGLTWRAGTCCAVLLAVSAAAVAIAAT